MKISFAPAPKKSRLPPAKSSFELLKRSVLHAASADAFRANQTGVQIGLTRGVPTVAATNGHVILRRLARDMRIEVLGAAENERIHLPGWLLPMLDVGAEVHVLQTGEGAAAQTEATVTFASSWPSDLTSLTLRGRDLGGPTIDMVIGTRFGRIVETSTKAFLKARDEAEGANMRDAAARDDRSCRCVQVLVDAGETPHVRLGSNTKPVFSYDVAGAVAVRGDVGALRTQGDHAVDLGVSVDYLELLKRFEAKEVVIGCNGELDPIVFGHTAARLALDPDRSVEALVVMPMRLS